MQAHRAVWTRGLNAVSWRLRRLAFRMRHEVLRTPPYAVRYHGYDVVYQPGDVLVRSYSIRGHWEDHVIDYVRSVLSAHAVIVDVGANIGLFSLAVLRSIPGSRVHMFEPSPIPQRCLAASLARNGLQERAALNAMALYSEPGELEFYVHDGKHSAYDGIRDTRYDWVGSPRPIRVPATTLDQYCQAAGLDRIDLLKIDAEGAELFVLRGAEQTLRTLRPLVLFEIGRKNLAPYGIQPAEVHEFLTARGYHVQTLRGERLDVPGFDRAVGWEHEFAAVPVPPQ